jgi:LPS O-antigen subunit length determinant protein (WzzB/FepE family)
LQDSKLVEEEIDLRDLFKTIWNKKVFIIMFTFIVTILSIVFVSTKTPIYEVKSVIKIGVINDKLLEESNLLSKELNVIFNVGRSTNKIKEDEAIVSSVSNTTNIKNLLEVSTQGYSNELAIKKNNEVLVFLEKEYKYKIDDFKYATQIKINNLKTKIDYIENVDKLNITEKIKFLKDVELKSIDNKLIFNSQKLKEYQYNINKISKRRTQNDTQNMLSALEILNNQTLILNLQNKIENLIKSKQILLSETLRKLKLKRDINLQNSINELNNNIEEEKLKLRNTYLSNSQRIGELIVNDYPIKPKKKLMVTVSSITAFILSIFIVFFMQFIKGFKDEEK